MENLNSDHIERAVLVGLITKEQDEQMEMEYLDELAFLAETAGAVTEKVFTQKLDFPNSRSFVGTGKLTEIAEYVKKHEIDLVVFDDELSPSQLRNIEKSLKEGTKVMDRSNLILDIFARRAKTAAAKTQVELAQYEYLLPRLTGMWTHLSRQKGGIGMRGPGEREIETDRRIIRDKIALLKEKLRKIDKQKETQRKGRQQMIRAALVGYTNVGKSTLMNLLTNSEVFAENKLFATLDTTVRKVVLGNLPFLLSDTVGAMPQVQISQIPSKQKAWDGFPVGQRTTKRQLAQGPPNRNRPTICISAKPVVPSPFGPHGYPDGPGSLAGPNCPDRLGRLSVPPVPLFRKGHADRPTDGRKGTGKRS